MYKYTCVQIQLFSPIIKLWRKKWQPTPVILPGEFHGQRSLVGIAKSQAWLSKYHPFIIKLNFYFKPQFQQDLKI